MLYPLSYRGGRACGPAAWQHTTGPLRGRRTGPRATVPVCEVTVANGSMGSQR